MTALAQERARSFDRWTYHRFPLAMGQKAWKHAAVGLDPDTGKLKLCGPGDTNVVFIGLAAETVDATAAEKMCNVNLGMEIEVEYFPSTGITAADLGKLAYFADDQTVSTAGTGPLAGRIMDYQAALGAGVQKFQYVPPAGP